ncbi:hypothetical protein B9K05_12755 [Acetobacter syzygii]|uniref:Uncharacterized protein n=1 Tax=Acetobacter syzygii TaxID=146476 RepID=A0A270B6I5_9PROT|nr:hypothetical protein B9K05_12755 [Acetobacter syzygii]PAL22010.1 hypothetical protein B9K04_12715 [Acetobacter syzygii]
MPNESTKVARQGDLFGWKRPRRKPRKLAHLIDLGDHGCVYPAGKHMVGLFRCGRCAWESVWVEMSTVTECRRGIPCERCNRVTVATTGSSKNADEV